MNLKISIVIPSYRQAAFLRQALDSVLEQDWPDKELIVIDGGSDDGSAEILAQYADRLGYWHSRADQGQSDALNQGFAMARGRILGWLCADDLLAPGALTTVARHFQSQACEWLSGRVQVVDSAGSRVPWQRQKWCSTRQMLYTGYSIAQPGSFWSRRLWHRVGGVDKALNYVMDYDLWLRFGLNGAEPFVVDRVLAYERRHAQQKTDAANLAQLREEKARVRLRTARQLGWGGWELLLRSWWQRRRLLWSGLSSLPQDRPYGSWYGESTDIRLDGLARLPVALGQWCFHDADERQLLRQVLAR